MSNNALFLAVSGMRGTGRTRLFKKLESLLPEEFRDQKFAFFEDPFGGLSHPLLWAEEERDRDPASRLFSLWSILNEFNVKKLRPALATHDVVLVDGYGLNALLYATAYGGDQRQEDDETTRVHHQIVRARVVDQGISAPQYFITLADCALQAEYLQTQVSNISLEACYAFIQKEERIIRAYFHGTGQTGHLLPASCSIERMVEEVTQTIERRLNDERQAA